MGSVLCSAAAAAAVLMASDAALAAASETDTEKHSRKKYSASDFLALCKEIGTAEPRLDAEVFSGFEMVVLLLDEVEDFMHRRCGTIHEAKKLFDAQGIHFSERTLKEYIARARRIKGTARSNELARIKERLQQRRQPDGIKDAAPAGVSRKPCAVLPSAGDEAGGSEPFAAGLPAGGSQAAAPSVQESAKVLQAKKDRQAKRRARRRARRSR